MRRALSLGLSSVVLAAAGVAVTQAPAAAYTTTIGELTVTTGHVSGTVTTDAPAFTVAVRHPGAAATADTIVVTGHPGGDLAIDLETWGLTDAQVSVKACDAAGTNCSMIVSTTFTAEDVAPEVVWPEDTTIGPDQSYDVTVNDPSGGGVLRAGWSHSWPNTLVQHTGTTTLDLRSDGSGTVAIQRCATVASSAPCRSVGESPTITVDREFYLGLYFESPLTRPINPATNGPLNVGVYTAPEPAGQSKATRPLRLEWDAVRQADGTPVPGVGGAIDGIVFGDSETTSVDLDLGALPDGKYGIRGRLVLDDPDFGVVRSNLSTTPTVVIDTAAPVISSMTKSAGEVYPANDNYLDSVVTWAKANEYGGPARLEVVNNATNTVVRTLGSSGLTDKGLRFYWNGRLANGVAVPGGTYRLRAVVSDKAGNESAAKSVTVTVVRQRMVSRAFRKTVSASGSRLDQYVGRCSTLKTPANRGWTGSLGYYSNTRCTSSWEPSLIETWHSVKVPAAFEYGLFSVTVYGGAATSTPGSRLGLTYINREGEFTSDRLLESGVGYHAGKTAQGSTHIFDDRYLVWSPFTGSGARYDVRDFTVKLAYKILIPDS